MDIIIIRTPRVSRNTRAYTRSNSVYVASPAPSVSDRLVSHGVERDFAEGERVGRHLKRDKGEPLLSPYRNRGKDSHARRELARHPVVERREGA